MNPILIVEDDASTREVLALALSDEGFAVRTAPDGAEALAAIGQQQPSLVLLDTRMPVMDGREFLRSYRASPGPHAPVISLTASSAEMDADANLAKPFDLYELIDLVHHFVE
jgi:two-component system response regulator MprA